MAINLNGTNQYAYADESFTAGAADADQTLAFFVKPQTLSATGYPLSVNEIGTDFVFFTTRMEPTSDIAGRHKTVTSILTAYTTIPDNAWTPVVVTFTGSTGQVAIYPGTTSPVTATGTHSGFTWNRLQVGAVIGSGSTAVDFFKGKVAYAMHFERVWNSTEISTFINASSTTDIDSISTTSRIARYDLISDLLADGDGVGLTGVNTPTFDSDDPLASVAVAGISSKTLERDGVAVSAATADVFVWAGHDVNLSTATADYVGLASTVTSGVIADIDLSATSITVGSNITVVVIPATGGPGIVIETTAEDIA